MNVGLLNSRYYCKVMFTDLISIRPFYFRIYSLLCLCMCYWSILISMYLLLIHSIYLPYHFTSSYTTKRLSCICRFMLPVLLDVFTYWLNKYVLIFISAHTHLLICVQFVVWHFSSSLTCLAFLVPGRFCGMGKSRSEMLRDASSP